MAEEASLFPTESGMCGKMRKQTIIQVTNESLNPDHYARAVSFFFLPLSVSAVLSQRIFTHKPR